MTDKLDLKQKIQFCVVVLMSILTGAEVDLFVPSFPELQAVFELSPFMVELTLGINLAAHCFSSLIVGNLGDRYGRKPVIVSGLIIFTIGSFFCVFAAEYWQLLFGRLLQGVGIAGPGVISYLIIADTYPPQKQQQLMGILNGCMTLAMAFAPVVGSYVSLFFHWQGNFVVLLILGLACLTLCTIFIPFRPSNSEASISIREYRVVIQSPKALYYMGTIVLLILSYWVFVGIAPILYMEDLGVPLSEFGFYQGSMAATFALASFSSGYFIKRFGQRACFIFGMGSSGIFMFLNLLLIFSGVKNPLIITIVVQFLALGIIFPVNILYPLSLDAVPRAKARISALISSSRFILTAVTIQIVSYIYDGTFMFIGLSMFLILGLMFICCFKLFREEKNICVFID